MNDQLNNLYNLLKITVCICILLLVIIFLLPEKEADTKETQTYAKPDTLSLLLKEGQTLFQMNCATCHAIHVKRVGSGLTGITKRRDIQWIRRFIRNPREVIESGDPYAVALYNEYQKVDMTAFPNLTDREIDAILVYIESDGCTIKTTENK